MKTSFRHKSLPIIIALSCMVGIQGWGQSIQVRGGFLTDSVRVGDQTAYFLVAEYPRQQNILFPDSTYNFDPFEFERKQYFPTRTTNNTSYDSAVYYLSTFEIDPVQYLSLPIFILQRNDSAYMFPVRDSVLLTELVTGIPLDSIAAENLPLRPSTYYEPVLFLFNYPILLIVVGSLVIILIILYFIFGKQLRAYLRARRMLRLHRKFIEAFTAKLQAIQRDFTIHEAEAAVSLWKKYMEQLEAKPYTTLTTREVFLREKDDSLRQYLKAVDRALYGNSEHVVEPLEKLRAHADHRFQTRLNQLKRP